MEQLAARHSNCFLFNYIQESTQDSIVYPVLLCNVIRVSYAVRRPCSDFMDMLRRLTSCRIIIIINGIWGDLSGRKRSASVSPNSGQLTRQVQSGQSAQWYMNIWQVTARRHLIKNAATTRDVAWPAPGPGSVRRPAGLRLKEGSIWHRSVTGELRQQRRRNKSCTVDSGHHGIHRVAWWGRFGTLLHTELYSPIHEVDRLCTD